MNIFLLIFMIITTIISIVGIADIVMNKKYTNVNDNITIVFFIITVTIINIHYLTK